MWPLCVESRALREAGWARGKGQAAWARRWLWPLQLQGSPANRALHGCSISSSLITASLDPFVSGSALSHKDVLLRPVPTQDQRCCPTAHR